jgi:hypothetical protein
MTHRTTMTTRSLCRDSVARRRAHGGALLLLMVSLVVVVVQADLQLTMSCLDSAAVVVVGLVVVVAVAVARCLDWVVRVLEVVWASTWTVKGHVVASMLMTGLIGAAAVMVAADVVVELADTRVADVLREGSVVVDVARGGVARERHVEEGVDVTKFALYHLQISISFTHALKLTRVCIAASRV